jgi:hypothetical protein
MIDLRRTIAGVGSLYREATDGERQYAGTCFSVLDPGIFVTAAHCLGNEDVRGLWINHFGASDNDCFNRINNAYKIPEADIAVVMTDATNGKWVRPFAAVQFAVDYGEEIYAIGHPDIFQEDSNERHLRFLRGIIQRPFLYEPPRGKPYSAFELSFACPTGLSGAPIILAKAPQVVIGVVTANYDTHTVVDTEKIEGESRVVETRRIISYGVAANIMHAAPKLEELLGRPLPNPLAYT